MCTCACDRRRDNETTWRNFICRSSHPFAAFFHLAFKAGALTLYLFGTWFSIDYVSLFVVSVLLLAFDFWTVKNVTGRLLVGLRWWVSIKEDGGNEWQFESAPTTQVPALDYRIFWWALYLAPLVWCVEGEGERAPRGEEEVVLGERTLLGVPLSTSVCVCVCGRDGAFACSGNRLRMYALFPAHRCLASSFARAQYCRALLGTVAFISMKLEWLLITIVGAGLTGG